ncbi:MAG: efflux RND transporter periplasmic adaptor subunit [Acidobacteria bacterium]|nr:efflux RND transporter periplasmic adaptor subunit [Acidobacteriota bacterium]
MAQQSSNRSYGWVWLVVVLAAGFWLFLYVRSQHGVVTIEVAKMERQNLTRTKSTNGRVIPLEDFEAHAPMPGEVNQVFARLNEKVKQGQQLVLMDDAMARKDLATATAGLASSEAALKAMEQGGTQDERLSQTADLNAAMTQVQQESGALAALQKLQTEGAASANEVAQAQQRLSASQSRVAQIQQRKTSRYSASDLSAQKAQVAEAEASVDAARAVLAGVDIRAPFAGTVYALPVKQYEFVQAGETLIQVADLKKLQIEAYFDEPEIGLLKDGQTVTIKWGAKPDKEWHGRIVQAPTTIVAYGGTRNVGECLISVDDANDDLLPNTNVTVTVTELRHEDVLSLPREALHTEGATDFVYRVVDDRLVKTPVVAGVTNLTRFEVLSGLGQGDVVALQATSETDLSNGLHVKVKP